MYACVRYKLCLIKLDRRQLRLILQHKKAPVRAVGILYLRIVVDSTLVYQPQPNPNNPASLSP